MTASAEIIYSALTINFVQVFQIIWPNSAWIVFNGRNPYKKFGCNHMQI